MQFTRNHSILLASMAALSVPFCAIGQSSKGDIQQRLIAKYAITTATADWTDITTAGAVVVLKKDNLLMLDVNAGPPFANTYKDGKLGHSTIGGILTHPIGLPGPAPAGRKTLLAGTKMWVTGIDVKDKGIVFQLFTDAIANVRYRAEVTFPFAKGNVPSPEEAERTVGEVFGVVPSDAAAAPPAKPAPNAAPPPAAVPPPIAPPPPPPADAAPPPIAPPPPPSDGPPVDQAPKSVALGMTADQVIAILGQPTARADKGDKGILLVYKDVKITLVKGKVTDIN